ncbi:MAG: glycosyltransferase family 32 protein, partial [Candidatus Roizmanbacteria bacterium]
MIPKQIWQTWKTKDVPEVWKSTPPMWQKHMPNWKYTLMTDTDNRAFVAQHYPYFLATYDAFPYGIQRADAIRACLLHRYGGFYSDLDLYPRKSIEHLFSEEGDLYLVKSANFNDYYTNAFMASKPGHPFWLLYIEEMMKPDKLYAVGKHLLVMMSTGPMALTRAIKRAKREGMSL